jgi:hypothetical protein
MTKNFKQLRASIDADPTRSARVAQQKRAILDALALAELREARSATQQQIAAAMAVSQANISRIEHQGDLYLSTLSAYVTALGGRLEIRAIFPDQTIDLFEPASLQPTVAPE